MKESAEADPDPLFSLYLPITFPKSSRTIAAVINVKNNIPPCRVHEESDPPIE